MARQARIVVPGVAHHVTQRGNYQQDVFYSDGDYSEYLTLLSESADRYDLAVSAYCLMPNHVHLIATPAREESLAKALGRTHLMYAQHVHRRHGRLGHLWQSRFYSCPMDEAHAHNAAIYVEQNPVRAGLTAAPWEYPWSSAGAHCGENDDPYRLLDLRSWRKEMAVTKWRHTLVSVPDSDPTARSLLAHTRSGRPLGNDAFLDALEERLGHGVRIRRRGRPKGSADRIARKPRTGPDRSESGPTPQ